MLAARAISITGAVVLVATAILSATSLAATSARPRPGHYGGKTSEHQRVTFQVTAHGRRITGFSTVDGYNNMCHYPSPAPHWFHYTVKVASMTIKRDRSFTARVKSTLVPGPNGLSGTFRVRGHFSSGTAHGTVTRVRGTTGQVVPCGPDSPTPTASAYRETFTAKPTDAGLIAFSVEWGPDGDAYKDIHTIRPNGTAAKNLTHSTTQTAGYPAWSADGRRLLYGFAPVSGETSQIYWMKADGSSKQALTSGPPSDDEPAISHDGRWIAFTEDTSSGQASQESAAIVLMHPNGTGRHVFLSPPAPGVVDRTPAFSPDDKRIAFSRNGEIDIADRATGNVRRFRSTNSECVSPRWSPNGKQLIALCQERVVKVVNVGTGRVRDMVNGVAADWSPDGTRLVIAAFDAAAHDFSLRITRADGSNPTEIWHTPPNKDIFLGEVAWGHAKPAAP